MPIRRGILVVAVVLTSTLVSPTARARPEHESLARCVPADVGLYIEGQHINDLLLPLIEPQTWLALAELAGQPARLEEATAWQELIRQAVRMEPAEALDELLAEQFAFVGEGLGRTQDGVVICRPRSEPRSLLRRWAAQPLPTAGRTSVYRLAGGIGVATYGGLLFFGVADVPDGMFARVLKVVDEGPRRARLADDPVYQGLLARVPEEPDAVLFARLRRASHSAASSPAAERQTQRPATSSASSAGPTSRAAQLPGPLHGASNIMLALHRERQLLRFSVVGDAPPRSDGARGGLPELVSHLPERTLAAWGFHLDYQDLPGMLARLPERSILRLVFSLQERSGLIARLGQELDSATCIAVGVVEPRSRSEPAPPLPALAVLVNAVQPEEAEDEFETLLKQSISFYGLMALKAGSQVVVPRIQRLDMDGADVGVVDVSGLMTGQPAAAIGELHICWALDGQTLIVASHLDWLRQIVAARHEAAPALQRTLALSNRPAAPASETIITLQTGPLADLGSLWLAYFQKTAPQILDESWWQAQRPGRGNVHLGVTVTEVPDKQRLRVTTVEPDTPADGLLRPGDQIVGYAGDRSAPSVPQRFATSQPIREIRNAIAHRADARWVDLLIERGGTLLVKRIPLPYVDPIQMLRRFIALGHVFQRVVYYEDAPEDPIAAEEESVEGVTPSAEPAGGRGFLTVELRGSRAPLFPFTPAPPPISDQARKGP
jgi:hypothetical protein